MRLTQVLSIMEIQPDLIGIRKGATTMSEVQAQTQMHAESQARTNHDNARPVRVAEVESYPLDTDLVLHDSRDGQSFALNHTGRVIWECCTGDASVEDIAGVIADLFAIPMDRARADTRELLEALANSGAIVWSAAADADLDAGFVG
jgi:hypothetical protein